MKKILLSMIMLYGSVHASYAPLYLAVSKRDVAEVQKLLDAGAEVDTCQTPEGITPLCHAIRFRASEIIELLLSRGADPYKKSHLGDSPFRTAASRTIQDGLQPFWDRVQEKGTKGEEVRSQWFDDDGLHFIKIKNLLQYLKVDPNIKSESGHTALHIAAAWKQRDILRLLIENNADVNSTNSGGNTPLHTAANSEWLNCEVIQDLQAAGAQSCMQNNDGNTPLHLATMKGCDCNVEALLRGSSALCDIRNNAGKTAEDIAVQSGDPKVREVFAWYGHKGDRISFDFDLRDAYFAYKQGKTAPIFKMISQSDHKAVTYIPTLLGWNELVSIRKVMHSAFMGAEVAQVQEMLKAGVGVNCFCREDGATPLHAAVAGGNPAVVAALLAAGADPRATTVAGDSPLSLAADADDPTLLQKFFEPGVSVTLSRTDQEVQKAWYQAARGNRDATMCTLLTRAHVDPNMQDSEGQTALHLAVIAGAWNIIHLLGARFAANLNIKNHDGDTPLHIAAYKTNHSAFDLLLELRADHTIINATDRKTAVEIAQDENNPAMLGIISRRLGLPKPAAVMEQ